MPKIIENVRSKLLNEGKKQLISKGYYKLNVRDITKQCGIAIGTFYNYFPSKEHLVMEIFETDWNKITLSLQKIELSNSSLKDKLRTLYTNIDKFLKNYRNIFFEMSSRNYECSKDNIIDPLYDSLETIIRFHRVKNEVTNPIEDKKLAYVIINNLIHISKNTYITFDELFNCLNI